MRYSKQDLQSSSVGDRFYNQFIVGPEFPNLLEGWQKVELPTGLRLSAHPGLAVSQAASGGLSVTLIGHLLDPRHPQRDNNGILNALVSMCHNVGSLVAETAVMGGRWVLLASDGRQCLLFNDALGLRQVFHTDPESEHGLWFMSQPGLFAGLKGIEFDPEALTFLDADAVRAHAEYRWPTTASPFAGIHHLLPNHLFCLTEGRVRRFWPKRQLEVRTFDSVVSEVGSLLKGTMDAASRRFDLALGLTAGFDSRIILAASRDIVDRLTLLTVRDGQQPDAHPDIEIAMQLARLAGRDHTIVKSMPYMSAAFSRAFKEAVFLAHDYYGSSAEAILNTFGRTKAVATGSGAEVAREPFRKRIDPNKPVYTAEDLAALQWMGSEPFAVSHFQRWLDEYPVQSGVHVLDLFSWEQAHGCWLASTQLEFDAAWGDIISPFNNRTLLVAMLGVDENYRNSPDHRLFHALIESQWPELMEIPVNPQFTRPRKTLTRRLVRKLANALRPKIA